MPQRLAPPSDVSVHDHIVVYPTFGHLAEGGSTWKIDVFGTVYGAGSVSLRKRLLLRLLQRVAKVQPDESQRELFEKRIREFIAPTERGKQVALRLGDQIYPMQHRTRRNGQFRGTIRLTPHQLRTLQDHGGPGQGLLKLQVLGDGGFETEFFVHVHLLHHHGVSVISDIDDTIKLTQIHSRRLLLQNTFLREFEAIAGMAELYQDWAAHGAAFHYVSSSPWQLYASLAEMCERASFPSGSFHLRSFRLRDHMLRRLLLIRRKGKAEVIRSLLKTFPHRRFVFVGDSGEKDPEIYVRAARKRPGQVAAILVRQLGSRPADDERLRRLARGLAPGLVRTFGCPSELPRDLTRLAGRHEVGAG